MVFQFKLHCNYFVHKMWAQVSYINSKINSTMKHVIHDVSGIVHLLELLDLMEDRLPYFQYSAVPRRSHLPP